MRTKYFVIIKLLLVIVCSILLAGCLQEKKNSIVTINDSKLYMCDFLYQIYSVEMEGNQLDAFYQSNMGYGYWDYQYNNTTMRELAKNSILANVVMYEILSDQAKQNGLTLTEKEISANSAKIDDIIAASLEQKLSSVGLTREVLSNTLTKITLGDKYKNELSKAYVIDEPTIRKNIPKEEYSSTQEYQQAVDDAIAAEKEKQFKTVYNKIKDSYEITINFDYWDTITIGSHTVK